MVMIRQRTVGYLAIILLCVGMKKWLTVGSTPAILGSSLTMVIRSALCCWIAKKIYLRRVKENSFRTYIPAILLLTCSPERLEGLFVQSLAIDQIFICGDASGLVFSRLLCRCPHKLGGIDLSWPINREKIEGTIQWRFRKAVFDIPTQWNREDSFGKASTFHDQSVVFTLLIPELRFHEIPSRFSIANLPFTRENSMLTPTGKLSRRHIFLAYRDQIVNAPVYIAHTLVISLWLAFLTQRLNVPDMFSSSMDVFRRAVSRALGIPIEQVALSGSLPILSLISIVWLILENFLALGGDSLSAAKVISYPLTAFHM